MDDHKSLEYTNAASSHDQMVEIASQSDFYIFTSLLWVHLSDSHPSVDPKPQESYEIPIGAPRASHSVTPDPGHPDLGLLSLHRDRLAEAAKALQWPQFRALDRSYKGLQILYSKITDHLQTLSTLPDDQAERRKVRLMIDKPGHIIVDSTVIDRSLISEVYRFSNKFLPRSFDIRMTDTERAQHNCERTPESSICHVSLDTQPSPTSMFTTHKTSNRDIYNTARARAGISKFAPTVKEVLLYNERGEISEASLCTVYFLRDDEWVTPDAVCGGNLGVTRRLALENGLCRQDTVEMSQIRHGELIWLSNGARGFFIGRIILGDGKLS